MSMPSSRLLVATSARSRPVLSSSSTSRRCSRASDPWWALTSSSPASSLRRPARRSGEPAVVAEDQRGAVVADLLEDARVHVGPDARAGLAVERRPRRLLDARAERAHVLDGHDDLEVELLAHAGVDDGHRARPVGGAAAEEARDLVERALRGREPDALRRLLADRVEPLERQREVRAALGARDRVDLVDDHPPDVAQRLACPGREHEVERLGRGDEDVGRVAAERGAFLGRGVAGADADGRGVQRLAPALGRGPDARRSAPGGSSPRRPRAP